MLTFRSVVETHIEVGMIRLASEAVSFKQDLMFLDDLIVGQKTDPCFLMSKIYIKDKLYRFFLCISATMIILIPHVYKVIKMITKL